MRAECWGDMLNGAGWDLVDEDEDIKLNPFEVAAIQRVMESRIETILNVDEIGDVEKDVLQVYLKLSKYVKDPEYIRRIENILYKVEVQKGDKLIDILKRYPETPNLWRRIIEACQQANLQIDMNQGTVC